MGISSSMGGVSNSIANTLTGSSTASNLSTFDCSTKLLEWKIGKLLHGKPISCKFKINTNLKKPIVKYTVEQREFIYQKNVAVRNMDSRYDFTVSGFGTYCLTFFASGIESLIVFVVASYVP